jgi:cytidylate kinase
MLRIAIDGPAGSGKSTVARRLATELGLDYLDTGAMYRAVAVEVLERGIDPAAGEAVAEVARGLVIEAGERVTIDGRDVTEAIRGPEATAAVGAVAANAEVREVLVAQQRSWMERRGGGVMEGRDIGTVVLPDAPLKVYLTASPEVRAARRQEEADVARRDAIDAGRAASPMRPADDAVEIDTTERSVDDIVAELGRRARSAAAAGQSRRARPTFEGSTRQGEILRPTGTGFFSGEGPLARPFYRLVAFVLRTAFRIWFRLTVTGLHHVPREGPFVLVPVHRSNLDTVLMSIVPRRMRFMGKDSLWRVKWAAWLLSALGGFPVSRGEADRDALARTIAFLHAGEPVVLFAEGERKSGPLVQPLYDGAVYVAARTQVPIVPVGIGGSERAMRKGDRWIRPVKIHVGVGPAIDPPELSPSGRVPRRAVQDATENLRRVLQDLFDEARVAAGDV